MSQLTSITGLRNLRRNQSADLNARLPFLNQILAQRSQKEFQDAQLENMKAQRKIDRARLGLEESRFGLSEKEFGLRERGTKLQEQGLDIEKSKLAQGEQEFSWQQRQADKARDLKKEQEQREMGVKAAGLGFSMLGGGFGKGSTLGDITAGAKNLWSQLSGGSGNEYKPGTEGFDKLNFGGMLGGGLLGFGAGQAFGGKDKWKKMALGAGVGGIASFLGSGNDFSSMIGGGLLGGLGGLL